MQHIRLNDARILVIDDEPANVRVLEIILKAAGYHDVTGAIDPIEGLALYTAHRHDLVLLDLNMPGMDGFELLERIKHLDPDDYPPVVVLTALDDVDTKLRALEGGARDFVSKPFNRVELLSRVRNLLEMRLLQRAVARQNDVLRDLVEERTRELHDTRLEIIRRLGRAAEYRDNETGYHIIRMSKISQRLARKAGFDDRDAELMLHASPMHDIGKIGIPDKILLKPGRLDPLEWGIMQRHTIIGAEILAGHPSELLDMARIIALYHHEKWDGSGYPHGIGGEEIPLVARIVAIADVFDALTSERPYKVAWSIDDTLQEIRRLSGVHFDPVLIDAFHEILPEVIAIKEAYPDPSWDTGTFATLSMVLNNQSGSRSD